MIMNDEEETRCIPLNPDNEGLCRPLKAQYQKNGVANFVSVGSFGATGVLVIRQTDNFDVCKNFVKKNGK